VKNVANLCPDPESALRHTDKWKRNLHQIQLELSYLCKTKFVISAYDIICYNTNFYALYVYKCTQQIYTS
jgi:hypothetical protein